MRGLLLELLLRFRGAEDPKPWKRRIGSWMLKNVPGMLTCEEFEGFVQDYYEGILPENLRSRFDTHMTLCPMCRVHFESYIRAIALGQKVCEENDQLPGDIPEELVGAILIARDRYSVR